MNGVMNVLKKTDWDLGKKYQYVAVSIDPKENPSQSHPIRKKRIFKITIEM
jgi:protein SCO1/2